MWRSPRRTPGRSAKSARNSVRDRSTPPSLPVQRIEPERLAALPVNNVRPINPCPPAVRIMNRPRIRRATRALNRRHLVPGVHPPERSLRNPIRHQLAAIIGDTKLRVVLRGLTSGNAEEGDDRQYAEMSHAVTMPAVAAGRQAASAARGGSVSKSRRATVSRRRRSASPRLRVRAFARATPRPPHRASGTRSHPTDPAASSLF